MEKEEKGWCFLGRRYLISAPASLGIRRNCSHCGSCHNPFSNHVIINNSNCNLFLAYLSSCAWHLSGTGSPYGRSKG